MKQVISIVGPTGAGKTNAAIYLARLLKCPIISADSVQIYQGLDIGSGKVTKAEMGGVPHYLLDILPPNADFSAGDFERSVRELIPQLFENHTHVVLVGGTGLYFQTIWYGFDAIPSVDEEVREKLNEELRENGLARLVDELKEADPITWEQIDRNNPARVLRALEIYRGTGKPISEFRKGKPAKENPWQDVKIGIDLPRDVLYRQIEARIEQMLADGWLKEIESLVSKFGIDCQGLQALGYRELLSFYRGELSYEAAIELVKRNTRRYAKRQLTWFRRYDDIKWFGPKDLEEIADFVQKS